MLFMSHYVTHADYRHSNLLAFAKMPAGDEAGDGGDQLNLIGRWHGLDGRTGVAIFECDDPATVARWAMAWATTMDITLTPVVGDSEIKAIGATLQS
ncbi:DUF3303 family protein [uncultured Erythrobacter sp.]|uniref:DUF3303 domain-containing protein n=1 Tax=uncultured Erythrobacter sp. TaxID=263913 RepID=UPI00261DDFF3|nr:DUF3303 family protein [uncultured Erythrobacter sp.]